MRCNRCAGCLVRAAKSGICSKVNMQSNTHSNSTHSSTHSSMHCVTLTHNNTQSNTWTLQHTTAHTATHIAAHTVAHTAHTTTHIAAHTATHTEQHHTVTYACHDITGSSPVVEMPQKPSTWEMVKCGVRKGRVRVETELTLVSKMRSGVRMRLSQSRDVTLAPARPIKALLETCS